MLSGFSRPTVSQGGTLVLHPGMDDHGACRQFSRALFTGVDIHPAAKIGRRVFIDHGMGVVIGNTVQIGDDCTIYQGATIGGTDIGKENAKLTIKNNVVIGAGAQILGGVTVGENAQIGPSAVVLKSLGDGVSVGLPNHVTYSGREVKSIGFSPEDVKNCKTWLKNRLK